MKKLDDQSIIETGNALCKSIEELQEKVKHHFKGQKDDDSGKYRVQFNGSLSAGCYVEDRSAAQALTRIMTWFKKDNDPMTGAMHGELLVCQPGEPSVTVAIYTLYPTGRIVRYTVATQRRTTVNWGDEV
jgi:hypothetical protein